MLYEIPNAAQHCLYNPIRPSLGGENASGKLAFWDAIFGSVEVGTRCRDPETGGNIGEVCLDGLYALVTVRFRRLLSLHLYFQLSLLLQTLEMCALDRDSGSFLP